MNCHSAREIFPELLDRRTAGVAHPEARAHLAGCPDCQREFAALTQTARALDTMPLPPPSPRLRKNFYAMLEEEKLSAAHAHLTETAAERAPRRDPVALWRRVLAPLGAVALLALGFALGQRAPVAPANAPADDATKRELVALRAQMSQQAAQLNKMSTLVTWSIVQQQQNPVNERLRDVLTAAKTEQPSDKILDDLVQALTLDPNVNVRLRAVDALYPHAERELVQAGVLAALPREQNPLVQLELIDFVASAQVPNASPVLEKIVADESANNAVRDAAKLALAQF